MGKCSEFYNGLMKSLLQDNDIDMHATHYEEKSVWLKDLLEP